MPQTRNSNITLEINEGGYKKIMIRNLWEEILTEKGAVPHSDNVTKAFAFLKPKEKFILERYFDLSDGAKKKISYDKIARQFGLSRERIRQIIYNSIRKLRNPSIIRTLISHDVVRINLYGYPFIPVKTVDESSKSETSQSLHPEVGLIEDLNLSVRAYGCLKNAGIKSIDELTGWRAAKLLRVRNLGKGSLNEIRRRLAGLGLSLKNESPRMYNSMAQTLINNVSLILNANCTVVAIDSTGCLRFAYVDDEGIWHDAENKEIIHVDRWLPKPGMSLAPIP